MRRSFVYAPCAPKVLNGQWCILHSAVFSLEAPCASDMAYDSSCEVFRINKQLCSFSRDGRFLALAHQANLFIKNTGTFDDYLKFVFPDVIEDIAWSPDSEYVLCYSTKKAVVRIYSICYPEWKFKLTEGSAGIDSVLWTPDSKHIVTVADLKVELCVWSLIDHSVVHIEDLKSSASRGFEFSPDGKRLAVIVSNKGQDSIEIYKTKDWKQSRKLICEGLTSIDGLCWSPNSEIISIWCAISGSAKMIIYSTVTESYESIFQPDDKRSDNSKSPSSRESLTRGNDFDEKLRGLELVRWMPSGQLVAVSGHNETIVLLNCLTWNVILRLRLEPVIKSGSYLSRVFKECVIKEPRDSNRMTEKMSSSNDKHIVEEVGSRPVNIPIVKNETLVGGDSSAVSVYTIDIMEFSSCGQYLSIRHRIYPGTLWVWDIRTSGVDIIILQNNISAIKWDPVNPKLLIFTESTRMFEWNPREISCLSTPRGMTVLDARWHPTSSIVALCGYNRAVIYRFDDQ